MPPLKVWLQPSCCHRLFDHFSSGHQSVSETIDPAIWSLTVSCDSNFFASSPDWTFKMSLYRNDTCKKIWWRWHSLTKRYYKEGIHPLIQANPGCKTQPRLERKNLVFLFEFECDHFHALFLCEVCRCDILENVFHFKPKPMQPNWSLTAVINLCRGCLFG